MEGSLLADSGIGWFVAGVLGDCHDDLKFSRMYRLHSKRRCWATDLRLSRRQHRGD